MRNGQSKALAEKAAPPGGAQALSPQDAPSARAFPANQAPPAQPGKPVSQAAGRDQVPQPPPTPDRRVVFVSHANPEDNPAAGGLPPN